MLATLLLLLLLHQHSSSRVTRLYIASATALLPALLFCLIAHADIQLGLSLSA